MYGFARGERLGNAVLAELFCTGARWLGEMICGRNSRLREGDGRAGVICADKATRPGGLSYRCSEMGLGSFGRPAFAGPSLGRSVVRGAMRVEGAVGSRRLNSSK